MSNLTMQQLPIAWVPRFRFKSGQWIITPSGALGIALEAHTAGDTFDPSLYDISEAQGVGPPGPQGPAGTVGPQGAIGPQGANGANGPQGAAGPQGADGVNGAQGAAGAQGASGPQGANGPQGAVGAQGAVGPQGIPGLDGAPTELASAEITADVVFATTATWIIVPGLVVTPAQVGRPVYLDLTGMAIAHTSVQPSASFHIGIFDDTAGQIIAARTIDYPTANRWAAVPLVRKRLDPNVASHTYHAAVFAATSGTVTLRTSGGMGWLFTANQV